MAKRAATAEETVEEAKLCECGCGETVGKKARFRPGHDAIYKGRLLKAFDAGDTEAGETLSRNGWKTAEALAARSDKGGDAESRKIARMADKIARIDAKIATLMGEREALVVGTLVEDGVTE